VEWPVKIISWLLQKQRAAKKEITFAYDTLYEIGYRERWGKG